MRALFYRYPRIVPEFVSEESVPRRKGPAPAPGTDGMSSRSRQRTSPTRAGLPRQAQEAAPQPATLVRAGALPPGSGNRVPAPRNHLSAQDLVKKLRARGITGLQLGGLAADPCQPAGRLAAR